MFNNERFNFKILSVLRPTFPISERFSPSRPHHALIFRVRGKAEVTKGDDHIRLNKNDVTFVPKGCEYHISTFSDEEVIVIHFDAAFSKAPPFSNMHTVYPDAFATLFDKLFITFQTRPCGFVYRMDALFLSILEQIERQSVELQASSLQFRIRHAVDMIHANIANPLLSVDSLAAETGYCPSYFRRIFQEEMGMSPKEYLIDIRIRHAKVLLESGYYSVERVSELSGFTSSKYFSTAFKRITGNSPSSYLSCSSQK